MSNWRKTKTESRQLEQVLSDKEELDTKLQEEMEAKAHILSMKEKLEEEKAALTRSAEEQTSLHNLQLSQVWCSSRQLKSFIS